MVRDMKRHPKWGLTRIRSALESAATEAGDLFGKIKTEPEVRENRKVVIV